MSLASVEDESGKSGRISLSHSLGALVTVRTLPAGVWRSSECGLASMPGRTSPGARWVHEQSSTTSRYVTRMEALKIQAPGLACWEMDDACVAAPPGRWICTLGAPESVWCVSSRPQTTPAKSTRKARGLPIHVVACVMALPLVPLLLAGSAALLGGWWYSSNKQTDPSLPPLGSRPLSPVDNAYYRAEIAKLSPEVKGVMLQAMTGSDHGRLWQLSCWAIAQKLPWLAYNLLAYCNRILLNRTPPKAGVSAVQGSLMMYPPSPNNPPPR